MQFTLGMPFLGKFYRNRKKKLRNGLSRNHYVLCQYLVDILQASLLLLLCRLWTMEHFFEQAQAPLAQY